MLHLSVQISREVVQTRDSAVLSAGPQREQRAHVAVVLPSVR
jgi:hypothetical protein